MIKVRPDCKEFVKELKTDEIMFKAHTKRPSKHKSHIISLAGIIDSYLREDKRSFTKFAGKASPECVHEKGVIRLINRVSKIT